jgi:hypothetical protein
MNGRTVLLVVLVAVAVLLALPALVMWLMMGSMMGSGTMGSGMMGPGTMMGGAWWFVPLLGLLVVVGLVALVVWAVRQGGGPRGAPG